MKKSKAKSQKTIQHSFVFSNVLSFLFSFVATKYIVLIFSVIIALFAHFLLKLFNIRIGGEIDAENLTAMLIYFSVVPSTVAFNFIVNKLFNITAHLSLLLGSILSYYINITEFNFDQTKELMISVFAGEILFLAISFIIKRKI